MQSIFYVAGDAIAFSDIAEKFNIEVDEVRKTAEEIKTDFESTNSGINLQIFNDKAQLCSNPANAEAVAEVLNPIREKTLTRVVMEVCGIIAYKQPITRLEVENLRGFNSDYAITTLLENNLIEVVGRKDAIGKPLLFGTTDTFLKKFNLNSLEDLPDYDELMERIQVIKTPQNAGLFDYSHMPEDNDKLEAEELAKMQAEEQQAAVAETENTVVDDLLNALTEELSDTEEEQAE